MNVFTMSDISGLVLVLRLRFCAVDAVLFSLMYGELYKDVLYYSVSKFGPVFFFFNALIFSHKTKILMWYDMKLGDGNKHCMYHVFHTIINC